MASVPVGTGRILTVTTHGAEVSRFAQIHTEVRVVTRDLVACEIIAAWIAKVEIGVHAKCHGLTAAC